MTIPLLQHLASCSFPTGDPSPPPVFVPPGSGSDLGFGSEIRWPKPATVSQLQIWIFLNKQTSSLEQQQKSFVFP